jgi:hypothetical protein
MEAVISTGESGTDFARCLEEGDSNCAFAKKRKNARRTPKSKADTEGGCAPIIDSKSEPM